MEYRYLDQGDAKLLELSELPREGIALAIRTTGFDPDDDEIVEVAVCDLSGEELFHRKARPQNAEGWQAGEASGGLGPADVEEAPELYQFEEELSDLFDEAPVVVALHGGFARDMMEASWITLPKHASFDLAEEFLSAHDTADMPGEPASAASLEGIMAYFGANMPERPVDVRCEAALIAAAYQAFVEEQSRVRAEKGQAYWDAYERRLAAEAASDARILRRERVKAMRSMRISALLWLCAAAVFLNLAVQMGIRGAEGGLTVMVVAVAVFFLYKWVRTLFQMHRLSQAGKRDGKPSDGA